MMTRKPSSDSRPAVNAIRSARPYFRHRRPVAFDAINTVGTPFDLAHRGGQCDDRGEQAEPQRQLTAGRPLVSAVLRGFLHHVAVVAAGQHLGQGPDDDLAELLVVQSARQADDRDDERDE